MKTSVNPQQLFELELRKVAIEEKKLKIETSKLKIERLKAWTGNLSIVLSVFIAAATISFGIWNQTEQAKDQFEIKAAEIVMNVNTPGGTLHKAAALKTLFPSRLPDNFAESFEPIKFMDSKTLQFCVDSPKVIQIPLNEKN